MSQLCDFRRKNALGGGTTGPRAWLAFEGAGRRLVQENVSEGRARWETGVREMGTAGSQRAVLCVAFGLGFVVG